ncbi:phage tail protein [Burkholderia diffusa]|uniref:phage tail protein n=1 Tax=Burkholderia diffusa TaxID=488732 RepID=UPI002AAFC0ED|nr:phage tail protein [Burkholderia diffusa]
MAGNLIYITDAGRAALVAPGNTGTTASQVTQIGLATAAFVFKPDMTALPSELKRITTFGGDTVAKDTIHIVIQDDSADQYKLYGFGLYLDNGVLFGVYVQNDPILEKAPASMVLLATDTVFTSIDVAKLTFGPTSFLNPPATTTRKGVVELATQAEVDAGADDTRAVTPKTAAGRYAPLVSPALTGAASITSAPGDADAQLAIKAQAGALNREAKLRFFGTFGSANPDTGTRLVASIRAAFVSGSWGRESLGFWINNGTANDAASDAKQKRVMNLTAAGVQIDGGLSTTARPTFAGNLAWDAGNFNPGDYVSKVQTNAQKILSSLYLDRTGIGGTTSLFLDGDDGQEQVIAFRTGGKHKWLLSSAAALSNLNLFRYDDSGANVGSVLFIDRATGRASLAVRPRFNGYEAWDAGNFNPGDYVSKTATAAQSIVGELTVDRKGRGGRAAYSMDADAGQEKAVIFRTAGVLRWALSCSGTSDALTLNRFADDGASLGAALSFARETGAAALAVRPTWAGATPWDSMNLTPLDRNVGGQINGALTLYGAGDYGSPLVLNANGYAPRIQAQASTKQLMFTNAANTAANVAIQDDGTVNFPRARPSWAGLTPWDTGNFDPNSKSNRNGDNITGRFTFSQPGWQADIGLHNWRPGFDSWTYLRARDNGGIEVINSAYNAVTWAVDDAGTMYMRGQQILQTNGNLWLSWRGQWLSDYVNDVSNGFNGKANAGARVQWDSGVNNFGTIDRVNGALPAPWVVCGLSGPGNGTANAIVVYGVVLRNQ